MSKRQADSGASGAGAGVVRFSAVCEHGPGTTFQVVDLRHESGQDYTFLVSWEERFLSFADLRSIIAERLSLPDSEVEVDEL